MWRDSSVLARVPVAGGARCWRDSSALTSISSLPHRSRTGHNPKAKNNKVAEGQSEGSILTECREALLQSRVSLCPRAPLATPTPTATTASESGGAPSGGGASGSDGASSGGGASGSDGATSGGASGSEGVRCPNELCEAEMSVGATEVEEEDETPFDYFHTEEGFAWCAHCKARVSALDDADDDD